MVKRVSSNQAQTGSSVGQSGKKPDETVGSVNTRRVKANNSHNLSGAIPAQKSNINNHKLSDMSVTAVQPALKNSAEDKVITGLHQVAAHSQQGIPKELLEGLQNAANERGAVLLTRPVEPVCRTLIAEGWPTKHFLIKAKSSNWGAQAGTIPVLQKYSKLALDDKHKIDKYTKLANKSITEGCAQAVPLTISTARLNELEGMGYLYGRDEQFTPEGTRCVYFKTRTCHRNEGAEHRQLLIPQSDGQWAVYDADCSPPTAIVVIAQPVEDATEQPLPMTADIDPLMEVFPREELDLEKRDRLPLPMVSDRVVFEQVNQYRARAKKSFKCGEITKKELKNKLDHYDDVEKKLLADFYSSKDLLGKTIYREDSNLGNASHRTREMIQHYQQALDRKYPIIHHSVDAHSPATEEKANYPITAFFPSSLNMAQGICMIFNEEQLVQVLGELMDRGYAIQKNPLWKNPLHHNQFTSARDWFAQRLDSSIIQAGQHSNNPPPKKAD